MPPFLGAALTARNHRAYVFVSKKEGMEGIKRDANILIGDVRRGGCCKEDVKA